MFKIEKVSHMYNKPNQVDLIGTGTTRNNAFESLRQHLKTTNEHILSIPNVPQCIVELATESLTRNPLLHFTTDQYDVISIDGYTPQMDYYRLVEQ